MVTPKSNNLKSVSKREIFTFHNILRESPESQTQALGILPLISDLTLDMQVGVHSPPQLLMRSHCKHHFCNFAGILFVLGIVLFRRG